MEGEGAFVDHPLLKRGAVEARLYQQVILGTCASRNALVILPTALGKTVISLLVAVQRLAAYPWGKVLVLAPTVPLVAQHRDSFARFLSTDLPEEELAVLTGHVPPEKRRLLWEASRVVFATPQTVRNDLAEGRYGLGTVSLAIFDEAHRARSGYAYTEIARRYLAECPDPRVLGLTASPGSTRERVQELCEALGVEAVEFRTDADLDVAPYIQPIERRWHEVELSEEYIKLRDLLQSLLDDAVARLREAQLIPPPRGKADRVRKAELIELGKRLQGRLAAGESGPIYWLIGLQSTAVSLMHAIEVLTTQDVSVLLGFLEDLDRRPSRSARHLCQDPRFREALARARKYRDVAHPKLGALSKLVSDELARESAARLIVFAQLRGTVDRIVETLSSVPGARPVRFVGQASREGSEGLSQREQAALIRELREGAYNVLVATSIAEEGLDIPQVNKVVFYEPIPSEIRLIQRRGRTGRRAAGSVDILIAKGTIDEASYWASQGRERRMRSIVASLDRSLGRRIERTPIPEPPGWERRRAEARERLRRRLAAPRGAEARALEGAAMAGAAEGGGEGAGEGEEGEAGARWREGAGEGWNGKDGRDGADWAGGARKARPKDLEPGASPGAAKVARWLLAELARSGGEAELAALAKAAALKGIGAVALQAAVERLAAQGALYKPDPGRVALV